MIATEQVERIVFETIDEFNEFQPEGKKIEKAPDAVLFGNGGRLDSHALVIFVVAVEEKIANALGVQLTIADDHADDARSPFRSIRALTQYIADKVQSKA